jgi:hypothetical protein
LGSPHCCLETWEEGVTVLEAAAHKLPTAPQIELGLYRRPELHGDRITDLLEGLLWRALA